MAKKAAAKETVAAARLKSSSLFNTHVVYCGENLHPRFVQLARILKPAGTFCYHCGEKPGLQNGN
jgi:hypothetical protein